MCLRRRAREPLYIQYTQHGISPCPHRFRFPSFPWYFLQWPHWARRSLVVWQISRVLCSRPEHMWRTVRLYYSYVYVPGRVRVERVLPPPLPLTRIHMCGGIAAPTAKPWDAFGVVHSWPSHLASPRWEVWLNEQSTGRVCRHRKAAHRRVSIGALPLKQEAKMCEIT